MLTSSDLDALERVTTRLRETCALYERSLPLLRDDEQRKALRSVISVREALRSRLLELVIHEAGADDPPCRLVRRHAQAGDIVSDPETPISFVRIVAWDIFLQQDIRTVAPGRLLSKRVAEALDFTTTILENFTSLVLHTYENGAHAAPPSSYASLNQRVDGLIVQ